MIIQWIGVMQHLLGGGSWGGSTRKIYVFTKQLMGGAPRTHTCIQISDLEIPFTAKIGSWEDR